MSADGRIVRAFDRASDYDRHASVQHQVAEWLADLIARTGPYERVLEIGCGTGTLAALAARRSGARQWLATDLSPQMLARARSRLGEQPPFAYTLLDGEDPGLEIGAGFDLVCSSLAAQWFEDLPGALRRQMRLLRPGGRLLLATLVDGTFAEWQAAVRAAGGEPGTRAFPSADELAGMRLPARPAFQLRRFRSPQGPALEVLRAVKAIGAGTARPGHHPLTPTQLRRACRHFEDSGAGQLTYEVVLIEAEQGTAE